MSCSSRFYSITICLVGCMIAGHMCVSSGEAIAQSARRTAGSSSRGSVAPRPAVRRPQTGSSTRGATAGSSYRGGGSSSKNQEVQTRGFALVELFTSEGYRNFVRAQRHVEWVEKTGMSRNLPVYTLAFHVDRLNDETFKDPYSTKDATARQETYANAYARGSVVAPLTIINGEAKLPGSRTTAKDFINAALGSNPTTENSGILIEARHSQGTVAVNCAMAGWQNDDRVNVALVQKEATHEITTGEFAGQSVTHTNVVRDYKVVDGPNAQGVIATTLMLPQDVDADQFHVVVYAQSSTTGMIRSASIAALQPAVESSEPVASVAANGENVDRDSGSNSANNTPGL